MRRICWDPKLVRQLFTTEADTKLTRDSFLRLHSPIERIRVVAAKPYLFPLKKGATPEFIHEEELLASFLSAELSDPNRIFVLTGEPGSGKSHVARWLLHRLYDLPDRFPIHVPRRIQTLPDLLRTIADVTGHPLPANVAGESLEVPPAKMVRFLLAYLVMMTAGEGVGHGLLGRVIERQEFEALLLQRVARYQASRSSGAVDSIDLFLPSMGELAGLALGATPKELQEAWQALQHHLGQALRKLLGLESFNLSAELQAMSTKLVRSGRRPVLLLEDITAFDLLHDDLLTFLLDEAAGHFDALICWTTGFEQAYMRTFQLERYTARLSLSNEQMKTYALAEGGAVDMVRRYLDAVRPWCNAASCDRYAWCMPTFDGLYPFNRAALERISDSLIGADGQQRLTPRNLLDRAIKSYLAIAEADGPFPPLHQPLVVAERYYPDELFRYRESHPAFVALMGWYGQDETGALRLPEAVAQALDVMIPEELPREAGRIVVRQPAPHTAESSPDSKVPPLQPNSKQADAERSPEDVSLTNRRKSLAIQLQSWASGLRLPPDHVQLQRGMARLFALWKYRLPLSLGHKDGGIAGLTWGKGQAEANVYLAGDPAGNGAFRWQPREPHLAGHDETLWATVIELALTERPPIVWDAARVARWVRLRYTQIRLELEADLAQNLGMSYESWLIAARWVLLAVRTGLLDLDIGRLVRGSATRIPVGLRFEDIDQAELDQADTQIQHLLEASFQPVKGVWDALALQDAWAPLHPASFLGDLATVAHSKIDSDWRVGGSYPFRELVRFIKTLADRLGNGGAPGWDGLLSELHGVARVLALPSADLARQIEDARRLIGLTQKYPLWDAAAGEVWAVTAQHSEIERLKVNGHVTRLLEVVESHGLLPWAPVGLPPAQRGAGPGRRQRGAKLPTGQQGYPVLDYLALAQMVANLRNEAAYQAAVAAHRLIRGIQEGLSLAPDSPPLAVLTTATAQWQAEAWRGRLTPRDALAHIESFVGRMAPAAVKRALTLLRRYLPGA